MGSWSEIGASTILLIQGNRGPNLVSSQLWQENTLLKPSV